MRRDILEQPVGVWQIDGHRATPLHGELPDIAMHPVTEAIPVPVTTGFAMGGGSQSSEVVVLEFLKGLREMVRAQREVMLSYLGAPAQPRAVDATAQVVAQEAAIEETTAIEEPTEIDIEKMLLEQVSEHTGYPVDMLDLDLAADLSIDSIKRIEIVGELSKRTGLAVGDVARRDKLLEELATCKTLRAIIDRLESVKNELQAEQPTPAMHVAARMRAPAPPPSS